MSGFFPLKKVANDANQDLDFVFDGGCSCTSVVALLSVVNLPSETGDTIR